MKDKVGYDISTWMSAKNNNNKRIFAETHIEADYSSSPVPITSWYDPQSPAASMRTVMPSVQVFS